MDEQQCIVAVKDGDHSAFAPLVERYHVGLIIYCQQFTRDRSAAEDIAQEAFFKAYRSIHQFNPDKARFSTWLYQIARSRSLDYLRSRKQTCNIDELPEIESLTDELHDAQKNEIRAAVANLKPPVYRDVIEAYYWHGESYAQIAKRYDLPLNTVRTYLHRAKSKLQGVL